MNPSTVESYKLVPTPIKNMPKNASNINGLLHPNK